MTCTFFEFSNHAIAMMFKRGISVEEVEASVRKGEVIRRYPDDKPNPSFLILSFQNGRPLHVAVSKDDLFERCYIITVYEPDMLSWSSDFRTKI